MAKPKRLDLDALATEDSPPEEVRLLRRENERLRRENKKLRAGGELVMDAVRLALEDSPPVVSVPPAPKRSRAKRQEIAVCHLSDWQAGKVTDSYDLATLRQRTRAYATKVLTIADERGAAINECRVYLGGDMVEGETIFAGQAHEIEVGVFEQMKETAEIAAELIATLASVFPSVRVCCVVGNHGRIGRKGESSPTANWDRVLYCFLQLLLRDQRRVEFVIPDGWYCVDRVYGWGNLIVHGDQIRGGFAGFPWYGAGRKMGGWIDAIGAEEPWSFCWIGHFHTPATATINYRYLLANGTTESGNEYARAELASAGYPCQRFACMNEEHGIVADHLIYLAERVPPQAWNAPR